jgi:hypothetical protein
MARMLNRRKTRGISDDSILHMDMEKITTKYLKYKPILLKAWRQCIDTAATDD